jgi:ribosome-binding protein aMBF1 (putative translation factor)
LTYDVFKHILQGVDTRGDMNDFDQLITDIETEAAAEGPAAVAELRAFDERFRLAQELLAARHQAKISQKELSRRSGVQQADISKIERGEVVPQLTTMARLLTPLGRRLAIVEDRGKTAA